MGQLFWPFRVSLVPYCSSELSSGIKLTNYLTTMSCYKLIQNYLTNLTNLFLPYERLMHMYLILQDGCDISYDKCFCLLFNFCLELTRFYYMLLKSNHSDKSLGKTGAFDLKLTKLFIIIFVLISYSTNKYKLNNVVAYLCINHFFLLIM